MFERLPAVLATHLIVVCLVSEGALRPAVGQVADERVRVLTNARFWTGDSSRPYVDAVAIKGEHVLASGTVEDVRRAAGPEATVEDLGGRFVVPGFIDTHTHFNRAGALLLGLNLLEVSSDTALRRRVAAAHRRLPTGAWMEGGDWGAYDLESRWVPRRSLLDSLLGDRPALIRKWDASQYVANSAALRAAGLDSPAVDDPLTAEHVERVGDVIPDPSFEQRLVEARLALADLARHGVTMIHDITGADQMRLFQYLAERDSLTVRVCARPTLDHWSDLSAVGIESGFGDRWLAICGLKGFVDGIMGNSSARFRESYDHMPGDVGSWRRMMSPRGNLERFIRGADSAGLTPHIHAIGDLAVDTLLDMFERVVQANGTKDRRFRMIHAQVVEEDDFARFGELGIIAEVQPYHAIDDMRWMEERIGERARGAYAFRSLTRGGALLVFGSDWPGTNAAWYPADPLLGIYAAVTRQTLDGYPADGWFPEERITVQEALEAYTIAPAFAASQEHWKGKLAPGYAADLTVLSQDLFAIPPSAIRDVQVLRTMVGGSWIYVAEAPTP
jgi:predicted amidohydrolase YtcJ